MIKKSTYIREISPKHRELLEMIAAENKDLKTVPDMIFFALEKYKELNQDVNRLQRIIELKQKKIETLFTKEQVLQFMHEASRWDHYLTPYEAANIPIGIIKPEVFERILIKIIK